MRFRIIERPTMVDYEKRYCYWVNPKYIWSYSQNFPEVVVEDIMNHFRSNSEIDRDFLYSTLLKRGINKWLLVRKMLIRLKKLYLEKMKEAQRLENEATNTLSAMYWKGKAAAYNEIRRDLKLLCVTPRWVIWNHREPGLIDTIGMKPGDSKKWVDLYIELFNHKFDK